MDALTFTDAELAEIQQYNEYRKIIVDIIDSIPNSKWSNAIEEALPGLDRGIVIGIIERHLGDEEIID